MARGWESKSVEEQITLAEAEKASRSKRRLTPAGAQQLQLKESLLLSRVRVLGDIKKSRNPRHREILRAALADLEARLSKLET